MNSKQNLPSATEYILLACMRAEGGILRPVFFQDVWRRAESVTGGKLPHGTAFTTMRRMRERGWVVFRPRPKDRRIKPVQVTAFGKRALLRKMEYYEQMAEVPHA